MSHPPPPPIWARAVARCWHAWGLSLCYSGQRMQDRSYFAAAVGSFGRALRAWPGFVPARFQRGVIRGRELDDYAGAVADLEQAIALRPDWPEPYLQRGLFHRFNGRPELARADLERFVALAPAGYWRDEAQRQLEAIEADLQGPAMV